MLKIVMSVENENMSGHVLRARMALVLQYIKGAGLTYQIGEGVYTMHSGETVKEGCIYVESPNLTYIDKLQQFAAAFGQESVLLLDADDNGDLVYSYDRTIKRVGKWQKVEPLAILGEQAYTKLGDDYYICK